MSDPTAEDLCERGQEQLMETRYLEAEATLVRAEALAQEASDWDLLSRLYMPLQEARRQRRQRCGDGVVRLDCLAEQPDVPIDPERVIREYPNGQLLVGGWGSLEPSRSVRALAVERGLYLETFLAAAYPVPGSMRVVIAPFEDTALPPTEVRSAEELRAQLAEGCLVLSADDLPRGARPGTPETYARVMGLWEQLHAPFLAAADAEPDPLRKVELYRRTIRVDYACELAHQKLSHVARELARRA
jgi:hypothetical protein